MMSNFDPAQDLDYNDIYACDKCGGPTFRDAPAWAARQNAYIGEMKVLCNRCACTHKIIIVSKSSPYPAPLEEPWYQPPKCDPPRDITFRENVNTL